MDFSESEETVAEEITPTPKKPRQSKQQNVESKPQFNEPNIPTENPILRKLRSSGKSQKEANSDVPVPRLDMTFRLSLPTFRDTLELQAKLEKVRKDHDNPDITWENVGDYSETMNYSYEMLLRSITHIDSTPIEYLFEDLAQRISKTTQYADIYDIKKEARKRLRPYLDETFNSSDMAILYNAYGKLSEESTKLQADIDKLQKN